MDYLRGCNDNIEQSSASSSATLNGKSPNSSSVAISNSGNVGTTENTSTIPSTTHSGPENTSTVASDAAMNDSTSKKTTPENENKKIVKGFNKKFNFFAPSRTLLKKRHPRVKYGILVEGKHLESIKLYLKKEKVFGIAFDETDHRRGLKLDRKTGIVYGTPKSFHYKQLLKEIKITDEDVSKQVLQFHIITSSGNSIPIATHCLPRTNSAQFTFEKIEELILLLSCNEAKCIYTISDGSTTGDYVKGCLQQKFPDIVHLNDYLHLLKNERNRMLNHYLGILGESDEEKEVKFSIRTFVDHYYDVEDKVADDCEVPLASLHPRDKMAFKPVLDLMEKNLIASCLKSMKPEIAALGNYLSNMEQLYSVFHEQLTVEERKIRLESISNFLSGVTGLGTTGEQILDTIEGLLFLIERYPFLKVSAVTTNCVENYFSMIKGFFLFFLLLTRHLKLMILILNKQNRKNPLP